jgi:2-polyprenyl-3-methyl-5-hydroxy-6-metoxy-1,4-benzoquinol methylase
MPDIAPSCPLCQRNTSSIFDQREFRGITVTNRICLSCGLVYQSPRMTQSESQTFYEAEYRRLYQGQAGPAAKDLIVQSARAKITLEFISKHVKSCSYILDIGCSSGALLQKIGKYYHAQPFGIEPGTIYRQYAQSSGLTVYPSLAELEQDSSPRFNLISMMHVLEHLADPVEYLQHLREHLLGPDGWLLVEVPNLYAHDSFEVAHLISFSAHTLAQVIKKAGFHPLLIRSHGQPRSRILPLYLTLLARPGDNGSFTITPEKLVGIKRKIGFTYRHLSERLLPQQAWIPLESIKS